MQRVRTDVHRQVHTAAAHLDGSPKQDEGPKAERPDGEHAPPPLPGTLLSFAENGRFHNLAAIQGSTPAMAEDGPAEPACKSDTAGGPQAALLAAAVGGLSELTPQPDAGPAQLRALTDGE